MIVATLPRFEYICASLLFKLNAYEMFNHFISSFALSVFN
jgi:hypothetical protein